MSIDSDGFYYFFVFAYNKVNYAFTSGNFFFRASRTGGVTMEEKSAPKAASSLICEALMRK